MGFFEDRRKRKEIERLDRELNAINAEIEASQQRMQKLADRKTEANLRLAKACNCELDAIERTSGPEARSRAVDLYGKTVSNVEKELVFSSFEMMQPYIASLGEMMPNTALALADYVKADIATKSAAGSIGGDTKTWELISKKVEIEKRLKSLS